MITAAMMNPSSQHHQTRRYNRRPPKNHPFRGIRMRKWGKWVAEIREPNKRSRIWLGSYCTPVAAARAYDTAVFYLRGDTGRLNFPEEITGKDEDDEEEEDPATSSMLQKLLNDSSDDRDHGKVAALIRKKAMEVGARVDAKVMLMQGERLSGGRKRSCKGLDLNQRPPAEAEDGADIKAN